VRIYVLDSGAVKRTITYGSEKPRQDEAIIYDLYRGRFLANRSMVKTLGVLPKLKNLENSILLSFELKKADFRGLELGFCQTSAKIRDKRFSQSAFQPPAFQLQNPGNGTVLQSSGRRSFRFQLTESSNGTENTIGLLSIVWSLGFSINRIPAAGT